MNLDDLDIVAALPNSFYAAFTDKRSADVAHVVEGWARVQGLRFGRKAKDHDLPTWYALVDASSGPTILLTLQPFREIINAHGKRQVQGVVDVPFHRMSDEYFSVRSHREALLKRLSNLLPQGKTLDLNKVDSWWPISWAAIVEERKLGQLLGALEEAVERMQGRRSSPIAV